MVVSYQYFILLSVTTCWPCSTMFRQWPVELQKLVLYYRLWSSRLKDGTLGIKYAEVDLGITGHVYLFKVVKHLCMFVLWKNGSHKDSYSSMGRTLTVNGQFNTASLIVNLKYIFISPPAFGWQCQDYTNDVMVWEFHEHPTTPTQDPLSTVNKCVQTRMLRCFFTTLFSSTQLRLMMFTLNWHQHVSQKPHRDVKLRCSPKYHEWCSR